MAAVVEHETIPVTGWVFEDICGETLTHTAGSLHVLITHTENNNRVSGTMHFQPKGVKHVDESGRTYVGGGIGMVQFNEPADGSGAISFTTVDSFIFMGQGTTPNIGYQMMTHTTIDANGETTVEFERMRDLCG